ncbi:hypothetical protein CKO28_25070 [Rhodovibrio sodomensis]|uniref:Type 4 fimbrial biogenesis protein PilX N-terminal domain-containing protein n=1 Tax=Rhodovibrio sodomensis TaxID=1088 RepID=A0ABS1DMN4_9PROT|nr:hypothetical protein [Rhodovibrio sodomensis]MBK1671276.1 hypothetical protein [Rhodovibrio sodomensis]
MRAGRLKSRYSIIGLIAILITLQLLIMVAGIGGIATVEAVRGFVVGEAQYTKAQQRATSALRRYVRSGDTSDLATYNREMDVPRSIGLARIVLETPDVPDDYAHDFLVEGNIHPADVPYLVDLYNLASGTGFLEPATSAWREADRLIQQLDALALEIAALRQGRVAADIGDTRQRAWLDRIDAYPPFCTEAGRTSLEPADSCGLWALRQYTKSAWRSAHGRG